jgi:DNA helicase-2/ATP-dependent DNA helicase PcrA
LLAERYKNICVVGDADQSIYGWRGANMENILNFEKDYPQAKVVLLEQNYRSTKNILEAANHVIANNRNRRDKHLWTDGEKGKKITYYRANSDREEVGFIVETILAETRYKNRSYGDFAILYRTNAQSRAIEELMVKSNIPYTMIGGHKFYERKEIRDIISYLNILANPKDNISFERVINSPKRGIGPTAVGKLRNYADRFDYSLLEATQNMSLADFGGKSAREMDNFGQTMQKLQEMREFISVSDLVEETLKHSGYLEDLQAQNTLESQSRIENLQEFLTVTKNFDKEWETREETEEDKLSIFLNELSLVSDIDDFEETSQVTLMTLHSAKGLEFPIVFLVGLEEGIFPLSRAMNEEDELEEERRLAYVGITRAREELYLTNAFSHALYGKISYNQPSRFISEIDEELIQFGGLARSKSGNTYNAERRNQFGQTSYSSGKKMSLESAMRQMGVKKTSDIPSFMQEKAAKNLIQPSIKKSTNQIKSNAENLTWQVGDKAEHGKWGIGNVIRVQDTGKDLELVVQFPEVGTKRLMAKFAPITKV